MATDSAAAVVVGSGPNGLAAAITLAEAGWRVTVLEAAAQYGGGTRTEELTLPGFRHDVCSTAHPLAAASPAMRQMNLSHYGLELIDCDIPFAHPLRPGESVLAHRDVAETARGLGADGARWEQVVGGLARRWRDVVAGALDTSALRPRTVPATAALGSLGALPTATVNRRLLQQEPARALLAGLAAHASLPLSAPMTTGVGLLLGVLGHAVGWPVAKGGSQAIADAMLARLVSLGGEIVTGQRVRSIDELDSSAVVLLDLTPRQVVEVAGHRLSARDISRYSRWRYGFGSFKVDWALDAPVPWTDQRLADVPTLHVCGPAREVIASEAAVAAGRHPRRPYLIVSQPTVVDPSRAPEGRHTLWAYCHVPNGSPVDMTAAIEAQIERFAPGFADRVLARHVMGPAALEAHNPNYIGGDIGGGSADWRQLAARPRLLHRWRTDNPRVFVCSSSTTPGGGVHGMCGMLAARQVLRLHG
jgi:phytoene dehydrogenase-like protein